MGWKSWTRSRYRSEIEQNLVLADIPTSGTGGVGGRGGAPTLAVIFGGLYVRVPFGPRVAAVAAAATEAGEGL